MVKSLMVMFLVLGAGQALAAAAGGDKIWYWPHGGRYDGESEKVEKCTARDGYLGCPTVSTMTLETDQYVWQEFRGGLKGEFGILYDSDPKATDVYSVRATTEVVVVAECKWLTGKRREPVKFYRKWIKTEYAIRWSLEAFPCVQGGFLQAGMRISDGKAVMRYISSDKLK